MNYHHLKKNVLIFLVGFIAGEGLISASTISTQLLNKQDIDNVVLGTFRHHSDDRDYHCDDPSSINVRPIGDSRYAVYCGDEELDFSCFVEKNAVKDEYQQWYSILSRTPRIRVMGYCNGTMYGQK
ncbi:hypothetical protein HY495_03035 [Candidatus Woesearchaeota archaeon]|nr:hypothetical protein [Candidatus Woesearchaeota archaeon]